MRIGYFTNTYPRATDTFIQREVTGLRELGIEVNTFSVNKTGAEHDVSPEVIAEKNNTFFILPVNPVKLFAQNLSFLLKNPAAYFSTLVLAWKTKQPGIAGSLKQLFYFHEAVILAKALQEQQIDHVHNHLGDNSGNVTLLASRLTGIGYSIAIHGPHIFFDPTHWALDEKLRQSRFITCISNYCRSQMMLFSHQEDWQRLEILHCGVDPEKFSPVEPRAEARKILYTGRLSVEKGIPVLFESLQTLQEKGYDFELKLVGDGPDRLLLEAMAKSMQLDKQVIFTGFAGQDEVRDYLQQSDMFILPSFAEGVPVSLMEAMACGIPVISTYVGGISELIEHEQTGLLVPASDPDSLAVAIASYMDDTELRKRVSQQGRQKVVDEFNLDSEVERLAGYFRHYVPV